jgi:CubicO group peptidase (beta-lactamase class C family)
MPIAQSRGPYAARHMRRMTRVLALLLPALLLAAASPAAAGEPLDPQVANAIRDYVEGILADLDVPGAAVVVVDADGPVFAEGYGKADDSGRAATPQTPFRIASLSKQLTGLAVMQLVESGDLSLEATVHDYLPWFGADGSDTARITVRDLLAHGSGWSERDGTLPVTTTDTDAGAMERNVRRLADTPLVNPIGEFHYMNATYDVLGYLVAVVSGMSFEEYLQSHVLEPLGMTHTYLSQAAARTGGVAQGHYPFFGLLIPYEIPYYRAAMPSASIVASAEDLGHVLLAHLNEGRYEGQAVVSPNAMAELHRPLVHPFDDARGYGWGWWSYPLYGVGERTPGDVPRYEAPIILEHGGSLPTFASDMVIMPEAGYGIVVVMNRNDELAPSRFYQMHLGIATILSGKPAPELAAYDEPIRAYGRIIAVGIPLLQLGGVVLAMGRLRRWRRDPPAARTTRRWQLGHLVAPLVVDLGVPFFLWYLFFTTATLEPIDFFRVFPHTPDAALALLAMVLLGVGWGVVRTWLTLRIVRAPSAPSSVRNPELSPR